MIRSKARPLRVAMIIQAYLPLIGGAERQLAALAPHLHARGVELVILTRRYSGLLPFERVNGVPVHRLPIPGPKAVASFVFTLSALPLLRRLMPDVIHAHELLSPTTTAVAAKRLFGMPVVVKVLRGGILGDLVKLRHKPFGKQRIRQFRKWVDAFIAISLEIDSELSQIGIPKERRPFIPNGVDTDRFRPLTAAEKQVLRERLEFPKGTAAVYTGRLANEKRVALLISVWAKVRAAFPDATLLVLGTGEEEARLRRMAGPGVRFEGRVEDVSPYLQAADLFILPSATEGLSNALLEAMSCGLPVIATRVGGAPDVIAHGQNGWLIPPDDPPALRGSVLTLLGDSDLRDLLRQPARERILQDYALPVTADRLRDLYDAVSQRN